MDTDQNQELVVKDEICQECGQTLPSEVDSEVTEGGIFCRPCFTRLTQEVKAILEDQGSDINWSTAFLGAIGGGAIGVFAWWGVTVVTGWNIGLIAVVIGIAVAKGILFTTGGKRSQQLQIMAVGVSILSYIYANYLVLRSFLIKDNPELESTLTWVPNLNVFLEATRVSMDVMSLLFLGIVIWVTWQNLKPIQFDQ